MAWGRRTPSAQTPAWNQDDYHKEFAGKLKEQIEQGVAPWQDGLRACSPAGRGTEVVLACNILNQMTGLGRPMSYRIGR